MTVVLSYLKSQTNTTPNMAEPASYNQVIALSQFKVCVLYKLDILQRA